MESELFCFNLGCRFINLQVSSLTDKWYGESQKLAAAVFSLVRQLGVFPIGPVKRTSLVLEKILASSSFLCKKCHLGSLTKLKFTMQQKKIYPLIVLEPNCQLSEETRPQRGNITLHRLLFKYFILAFKVFKPEKSYHKFLNKKLTCDVHPH